MQRLRVPGLAVWALVGLAAALTLPWAFPRAFPFLGSDWRLRPSEAAELALDKLRLLGEPVEDAAVVVTLAHDEALEQRLRRAFGSEAEALRRAPRLVARLTVWQVRVYSPGAGPDRWTYLAEISPRGEVLLLQRNEEEDEREEGVGLTPAAAWARAEEILQALGFDPELFGEPRLRRLERPRGTDLALTYPEREAALGPEAPYGVDVEFDGDRLCCFYVWRDDSGEDEILAGLQLERTLDQTRFWVPFLVFALAVAPCLRRYNEGEVEVGRSLRIFFLLLVCGVAFTALIARGASLALELGFSRRQAVWVWGLQALMLLLAPMALATAVAWAAGEAACRERWGGKLAAFHAVVRGRFASAPVARASLRGLAAGLALAVAMLLLLPWLGRHGVEPVTASIFGPVHEVSVWPALAELAFFLLYGTFAVITTQLLLLPPALRHLGSWAGGALTALLSAVLFFDPVVTLPPGSGFLLAVPAAAAGVGLFLAYDLLTALVAYLTLHLVLPCLPWLFADDPVLQLEGAVPLVLLALPLLLSLPGLRRGEELEYRWDEVPPYVRRIAERERQRLELETARRIQSSILPPLPDRLDGVELAHVYLPATEVGGDFYDVAELPGGRLALAVGDVAGHGVGSGLVMAMARSALAVQVAADPAVERVFRTLNLVLHDTARKSLMTTLCYGVLDPRRRRLTWASAGHLFPWVIGADGGVRPLESVAYPLGVRRDLEVRPATVNLESGDSLVLYSDGVVEARPWEGNGEEPFGFERLEESLKRHAGTTPRELLDGVLADLMHFTGPGPRQDDQTLLVLRIAG